jgi:hypothetical protein
VQHCTRHNHNPPNHTTHFGPNFRSTEIARQDFLHRRDGIVCTTDHGTARRQIEETHLPLLLQQQVIGGTAAIEGAIRTLEMVSVNVGAGALALDFPNRRFIFYVGVYMWCPL